MARRKGMMVGSGKRGYHNIIGKDPKVHSDSAKGRKQPQKMTAYGRMWISPVREGLTNKKTYLVKSDFALTERFKRKKDAEKYLKLEAKKYKDTDGDGVPDSMDCDPKNPYKQDKSKLFRLNNEYSISTRWEKTRNGFRHVAVLYKNNQEVARTKVNYLNRTWESFEYETVINQLLDTAYGLTDKEREKFKQSVKNNETERFEQENKTISAIAQLGDVFANTKEEKNKWKKRMLKAGLPALDVPEDWDTLSEDEKEKRLNNVIKFLKEEKR